MTFSAETLSILVLISLGLSALALFVLSTLIPRRRGDPSMLPPLERLEEATGRHEQAIDQLQQRARRFAEDDARMRETLARTVQRVGLVRYDAFEDMGGRLSFSLALLDEAGDGVVVTSINGRQDTRVYAKPVSGGISAHNLSQEEVEAIRQAMAGSEAVAT